MDKYFSSTKPSTSRLQQDDKAHEAGAPESTLKAGKAKDARMQKAEPCDSLRPSRVRSADSMLPINGGIRIANRPIMTKLRAPENPVAHSTAYTRTVHIQSVASGHQSSRSTGGGGSGWVQHRNSKLKSQAASVETSILKGVVGYINGYTGKQITQLNLIKIIQSNGGEVRYNFAPSTCTHVFCTTGLSGSKTHKFLNAKRNKVKIVTPDWVLDSVRLGKRQSEVNYMVVFHEGQISIQERDIRKPHVSTYECRKDVPIRSPLKVRSSLTLLPVPPTNMKKAVDQEHFSEDEKVIIISSSQEEEDGNNQIMISAAAGDLHYDVLEDSSSQLSMMEDSVLEEDVTEDGCDDYNLPPSAQRC